ncbi:MULTISPECIES: bifunctional phosphoribosylaminoimidazolecarboxamide formyltransferase/IMP cyclohydrolase [Aneurinibacillus]|uniref:Bifunctional purine biosynthesis protein PurH n=1 Tax=Aneurinibacillus thermoaerophilus TaxID=143495 RepID=A0A1G8AR02_ANETH|nr:MULTISPECIES: bifunctional phosphoribosylaminoimidazolecarboxamide formyltransferase/IMP cyclohydrolase [Aneurinibacillus]AMA74224.1 bifunctional phosphoribosylaminoimidazolecarboxamide formyltransferase/inosine monophosphate cyclohydrolase [Aneurinibacillus sp. XH2]MED0676781.1 bifunctional phosphoribosylaminoimidazolecarboxamide formyltransferase/IMP cyclohydrolase [Aneurinibacillus thermoaerophilus]MED0680993.1 bifunctional phosphoribosylaminoimidazolecarboxamide formyltransferase/IMP cycl
MSAVQVKRALISVSDKTGIIEFAKELEKLGVEIISTGGTAALLQKEGVKVIGISDVTGFPEILDGRLKTLDPHIHGGLLAVRDNEKHVQQIAEHNITPIDLVVVNLYPFKQTISKPNVAFAEAIENIDIGGPTMLRSAAKNHKYVTVIVDADDYSKVLEEIQTNGSVSDETKRKLAAKVFRHTAAYDALISQYLTEQVGEQLPESYTVTYEKVQDLRYGENPHQTAAFYREPLAGQGNIATAKQLHGKELSYNNINDGNAALAIVKEFSEPAIVAVKHTNPCGVGIGATILEAYQKAYESDPVSIFGGIIAANRPIDKETALQMKEIFLEIIMAPSFTEEALEILQEKKNLRLLELGDLTAKDKAAWKLTSVEGGALVQSEDAKQITEADLEVVTDRKPTKKEIEQLLFAWKVVKHVKSNAIVLAKDNMTIGVGAGQMNRVGAARIAIEQAGDKAFRSVLASDAFFPMPDTVEEAAKAGITAVIQPGGSIRDEDSIKVANEHGIAMVFTKIRHFKH